jgi:hypothetical protein
MIPFNPETFIKMLIEGHKAMDAFHQLFSPISPASTSFGNSFGEAQPSGVNSSTPDEIIQWSLEKDPSQCLYLDPPGTLDFTTMTGSHPVVSFHLVLCKSGLMVKYHV